MPFWRSKSEKLYMGYPKYVNFSYSILSYQFSQPFQITPHITSWNFQQKIKWNHAILMLKFSEKSYMGYMTRVVVGKSVVK